MHKVIIVGVTSAIAEATARLFAERGDHLYILARDTDRLKVISSDLKIRGAASVGSETFEATDLASHEDILKAAIVELGGADIVLLAHGTLPDQSACEQSLERTIQEIQVNALSIISMLTFLGNHFEAQKSGTIAVISSVAGDRGRQSNYVHGAAKGMVSIFLQGLRNRLYKSGVNVVTIKPGFVDTPMTEQFPKGPIWASPEQVARGVFNAMEKGRQVVYLPWFWLFIMTGIRSIPEIIFKRMHL